MNLQQLLSKRKSDLVKRWSDLVVETYPPETQRFLRKEKDQFGNPVGSTISKEMEALLKELIGEADLDRIVASLDNIIRIRAIQDFAPSQAVGFVLGLKGIIREVVNDPEAVPAEEDFSRELSALEKKIDDTLLIAFDIYSKCRERIYDLRADEVKRQVSGLLRNRKLVCETPDEEADR